VIVFRDVSRSVPRIELLHRCQKFRSDPILLPSPYVIQSHVSVDAFTHFTEILGAAERHSYPEISDDLMLLAREFGRNSLITCLVPQRDFPMREGNIHWLLQELDRIPRGTMIEAEFQSIRGGLADVQHRLSMIEEKCNDKLEIILPELERMTKVVKQPSQRRLSNQRACIESLTEWIAAKSISFRLLNRPLFQEMVQCTNPDFIVPVTIHQSII
jgi:hypothetical protein